jgi:rhamnulokinase
MTAFAAVDLGASSGRVMLGRVGPDHSDHIELTEVHRFRNGGVRLPDGLYWDVLGLYTDVLTGLRAAAREEHLAGVAVDSWAVDYGLLDARGTLQGNPRHYRDPRTDAVIDDVHAKVDRARLYGVTGLQFLPFNTLYQLAAEPALDGRRALLVPDLLGYWLTGRQVAEETNASTTGLLDARTGGWSTPLVEALGLPPGLLPDVIAAGELLAALTAEVSADIGVDYALPVTTVGSHDTASAVVGVPADNPRFGYISCGTWGLVGVELDAPVLTEDSRKANFTNERGVDGTIRYLRNVMGLWLLSESMRTWDLRGRGVDLGDVLAAAAVLPAGGPRVDPNDPVFLPPGDMPARIEQWYVDAGLAPPASRPAMVRAIVESLAQAFTDAVESAARLSGQRVEVIHLVGGGALNELLCQSLADRAGRPVLAGPVEATALGNVLVQGRAAGALTGDLAWLRRLVAATHEPRTFTPRASAARMGR